MVKCFNGMADPENRSNKVADLSNASLYKGYLTGDFL